MDFTWPQIIAALGGAAGLITALLGIAKYASERLDARSGRKKEQQDKERSDAVEGRKLDLQEEQVEQDGWESLAKERGQEIKDLRTAHRDEITGLKKEIEEQKAANVLSRPVVTQIYRGLHHLERRIKSLAIAKLPDEVVDILNDRRAEALEEIGKLRDLLP